MRRRARRRGPLYASWNGATEVASWRVLGRADADGLTPLASAARTRLRDGDRAARRRRRRYLAVQALDAAGAVLGSLAPAVEAPALGAVRRRPAGATRAVRRPRTLAF